MVITFHRFYIYLFFHEQNLQICCIILTIKLVFFQLCDIFITYKQKTSTGELLCPYLTLWPYKVSSTFHFLSLKNKLSIFIPRLQESFEFIGVLSVCYSVFSPAYKLLLWFGHYIPYGCNCQWNSHLFWMMLNFIWQLLLRCLKEIHMDFKKWNWPNMKCSFRTDKWKVTYIKRNSINQSYIMLNLHYVVCFHSGNKSFSHPEFLKINN